MLKLKQQIGAITMANEKMLNELYQALNKEKTIDGKAWERMSLTEKFDLAEKTMKALQDTSVIGKLGGWGSKEDRQKKIREAILDAQNEELYNELEFIRNVVNKGAENDSDKIALITEADFNKDDETKEKTINATLQKLEKEPSYFKNTTSLARAKQDLLLYSSKVLPNINEYSTKYHKAKKDKDEITKQTNELYESLGGVDQTFNIDTFKDLSAIEKKNYITTVVQRATTPELKEKITNDAAVLNSLLPSDQRYPVMAPSTNTPGVDGVAPPLASSAIATPTTEATVTLADPIKAEAVIETPIQPATASVVEPASPSIATITTTPVTPSPVVMSPLETATSELYAALDKHKGTVSVPSKEDFIKMNVTDQTEIVEDVLAKIQKDTPADLEIVKASEKVANIHKVNYNNAATLMQKMVRGRQGSLVAASAAVKKQDEAETKLYNELKAQHTKSKSPDEFPALQTFKNSDLHTKAIIVNKVMSHKLAQGNKTLADSAFAALAKPIALHNAMNIKDDKGKVTFISHPSYGKEAELKQVVKVAKIEAARITPASIAKAAAAKLEKETKAKIAKIAKEAAKAALHRKGVKELAEKQQTITKSQKADQAAAISAKQSVAENTQALYNTLSLLNKKVGIKNQPTFEQFNAFGEEKKISAVNTILKSSIFEDPSMFNQEHKVNLLSTAAKLFPTEKTFAKDLALAKEKLEKSYNKLDALFKSLEKIDKTFDYIKFDKSDIKAKINLINNTLKKASTSEERKAIMEAASVYDPELKHEFKFATALARNDLYHQLKARSKEEFLRDEFDVLPPEILVLKINRAIKAIATLKVNSKITDKEQLKLAEAELLNKKQELEEKLRATAYKALPSPHNNEYAPDPEREAKLRSNELHQILERNGATVKKEEFYKLPLNEKIALIDSVIDKNKNDFKATKTIIETAAKTPEVGTKYVAQLEMEALYNLLQKHDITNFPEKDRKEFYNSEPSIKASKIDAALANLKDTPALLGTLTGAVGTTKETKQAEIKELAGKALDANLPTTIVPYRTQFKLDKLYNQFELTNALLGEQKINLLPKEDFYKTTILEQTKLAAQYIDKVNDLISNYNQSESVENSLKTAITNIQSNAYNALNEEITKYNKDNPNKVIDYSKIYNATDTQMQKQAETLESTTAIKAARDKETEEFKKLIQDFDVKFAEARKNERFIRDVNKAHIPASIKRSAIDEEFLGAMDLLEEAQLSKRNEAEARAEAIINQDKADVEKNTKKTLTADHKTRKNEFMKLVGKSARIDTTEAMRVLLFDATNPIKVSKDFLAEMDTIYNEQKKTSAIPAVTNARALVYEASLKQAIDAGTLKTNAMDGYVRAIGGDINKITINKQPLLNYVALNQPNMLSKVMHSSHEFSADAKEKALISVAVSSKQRKTGITQYEQNYATAMDLIDAGARIKNISTLGFSLPEHMSKLIELANKEAIGKNDARKAGEGKQAYTDFRAHKDSVLKKIANLRPKDTSNWRAETAHSLKKGSVKAAAALGTGSKFALGTVGVALGDIVLTPTVLLSGATLYTLFAGSTVALMNGIAHAGEEITNALPRQDSTLKNDIAELKTDAKRINDDLKKMIKQRKDDLLAEVKASKESITNPTTKEERKAARNTINSEAKEAEQQLDNLLKNEKIAIDRLFNDRRIGKSNINASLEATKKNVKQVLDSLTTNRNQFLVDNFKIDVPQILDLNRDIKLLNSKRNLSKNGILELRRLEAEKARLIPENLAPKVIDTFNRNIENARNKLERCNDHIQEALAADEKNMIRQVEIRNTRRERLKDVGTIALGIVSYAAVKTAELLEAVSKPKITRTQQVIETMSETSSLPEENNPLVTANETKSIEDKIREAGQITKKATSKLIRNIRSTLSAGRLSNLTLGNVENLNDEKSPNSLPKTNSAHSKSTSIDDDNLSVSSDNSFASIKSTSSASSSLSDDNLSVRSIDSSDPRRNIDTFSGPIILSNGNKTTNHIKLPKPPLKRSDSSVISTSHNITAFSGGKNPNTSGKTGNTRG